MGEPLLRVAEREAVGLGGAVVLDDDRAPPLDHLLLHRHRARRRGVDDDSSDDRSAAARTSSGSLSSRENIVGTICECVMRCSRDEIEELRGVELLHDHRRAAEPQRARDARLRRGVVERRRRQVGLPDAEPEHAPARTASPAIAASGCTSGSGTQDALRLSGRARRVEHRRAELLVVDRLGRELGHRAARGLSKGASALSMSTMSHRSTFGHSAGSCIATSRFAAEVTTMRASLSLMMYATSSGDRYELMHV